MPESIKTTIVLPEKVWTELKIMCILTKKKQSDFIRIAIQDKINQLKKTQINKPEGSF
jgi:hypothetical protein